MVHLLKVKNAMGLGVIMAVLALKKKFKKYLLLVMKCGMITTNISKNIDKIRSLSFHGWDKDPLKRFEISKSANKKKNYKHWMYNISNLGFKYNMNDLMASIGIAQFKKLKSFNLKREKIIKRYLKGIKNCKGIVPAFPYFPKNSSYWMFSIKCKKRDFYQAIYNQRVSRQVCI